MGGGGANYAIPDWRKYKVENAPELMQVQRALASQGLRDPWLRNEVWRFDTSQFGVHGHRLRRCFFRGFSIGLIAAVATVAVERALGGGHGHGHDAHH